MFETKPLLGAVATQDYSSGVITTDTSGAGREADLMTLIKQNNLNGITALLALPGIDINQHITITEQVLKSWDKSTYYANISVHVTPLMLAISQPQTTYTENIIKLLLLKGADPNIPSDYLEIYSLGGSEVKNRTPFAHAAFSGRNNIALLLIAGGLDVNGLYKESPNTPEIPLLHLAIQYCNADVIKAMLDKDADKNSMGQQILYNTSQTERCFLFLCCVPIVLLSLLTCCYFSRSSAPISAVQLATNLGKTDIVELLNNHKGNSSSILHSQQQPSTSTAASTTTSTNNDRNLLTK